MRTLELLACPVCGGPDAAAVELPGGARLRRCTACRTVYAERYADPEEVFRAGYLTGAAGDFGLDLSHPAWQRYLAEVGARRSAILAGATGGRGRLLDVGCGSGEFAAAAARDGWRVTAVEPLPDAAEAARRRPELDDVRTGLLADAGLEPGAHELVCAFHVLEHLPAAEPFLRELAAHARPGGHVAVEVPNFASAARRRHGSAWPHLRPLEHLVHFTPGTLRTALERAGLQPVDVRTWTWITRSQTLDQQLADVARPELRRRLAPLPAGWRTSWLAHHGSARERGAVVLGIARVP